jgi:AcrR family transcriptional regulator
MNMFKTNTFNNSEPPSSEITSSEAPPTVALSKAEVTRAKIFETALALFRQKGFDATTMREISAACGMALGTAYHHFDSKEAIVGEYYIWVHYQHRSRVEAGLPQCKNLKERLELAFFSKLEILQTDQDLLRVIMRYMGDSDHPLSIFGPETQRFRLEGVEIFRQALGQEKRLEELQALGPLLLWALHMGMLLYFLHDKSVGLRTQKLTEKSLELVVQLFTLASNPLLQPLLKPVLKKVSGLLEESGLNI